jgi:hypothetical protein
MKLSEFQHALAAHAAEPVTFILPGGEAVPAHAHITEVGRTEKHFVDCGGKVRRSAACSLQIWVADDLEHRLPAGKLAVILDQARGVLGDEDLEMQVECQQDSLSLFGVERVDAREGSLAFALQARHAACLAMDVCLPAAEDEEESCCGSGSGCCR